MREIPRYLNEYGDIFVQQKIMKNKEISKKVSKCVTSMLEKALCLEANSTSCIVIFQPKAPEGLEKFRKIK